jgi:hypothetical protein
MASFTGGEKLQARLAEIAKSLESGGTLRVGFLEGGQENNGASLPMVAAIHEFGAPAAGIPPRSFMRPTVAKHSAEWGNEIAQQLPRNDYSAEIVLGSLGEIVRREIQQSIVEIDTPALSPVTLMLRKMFGNHPEEIRGRDVGAAARKVAEGKEGATGTQAKPLVWTGVMLKSVAYEVKS